MTNDLIAIVTPIGNELAYLQEMYENLSKVHWHLWITVVDSFCQDGSDIAMLELAKSDSRIIVLHIGKGTGVANAYIRGVQHAITLDATKIIEVDVGHPVDLIPQFVKLLDQVPVVMGTRFNGGQFVNVFWRRKLLSKLGTAMAHFVLHLPFSDCTSGLQGFTNRVAIAMPFDKFQSTGHFYQTEFKFYCQYLPFIEVPFTYIGTKSSVKVSTIKESLCILFRLFRQSNDMILSGDYTPMSDDRKELLISIKEDLRRLSGNEIHIISYHLQSVLHRVFVQLIHLIEMETTKDE